MDCVNGRSGESLRAMIDRACCSVTTVSGLDWTSASGSRLRASVSKRPCGLSAAPRPLMLTGGRISRLVKPAGNRVQLGGFSGLDDLPGQIVADNRAEALRDREKLVEIHPRRVAHAFEHVHEILGADVSGRPRGERTTAQSAQACLVMLDPRRPSREDIGKPH